MAIITGSATGSNKDRIDVELVYTTTELSAGHQVTVTLRTRVKENQTSNTYDNQATWFLIIDGTKYTTGSPGTINYKTNKTSWQNLISKTVNISHTNAKTINISGSFTIDSTYVSGGSASGNIPLPALYTKCGTPTNVQVKNTSIDSGYSNSTIQAPAKAISIKWNAPSGGTNNPITGYRVYYRKGAHPISSSSYKAVTGTATETTLTFITTVERGSTYYIAVQAIGSQEGYDSDLSSTTTTIKINTLPTAPQLTIDQTNYAAGGSHSIEIKTQGVVVNVDSILGTDSDTNFQSTLTYKYSTSPTGSKLSLVNGQTFTINDDITYYFYTYDGIEYSSATLVQFRISYSLSEVSVENSGNSYNYNNTTTYYKNKKIKYTVSRNGTLSYTLNGVTKSLQVEGGSGEILINNFKDFNLKNNTSYDIKVDFINGNSITTNFINAPEISSFNSIANELSNKLNNYFYSKLKITFTKDTGLEKVILQIKKDTQIIAEIAANSVEGEATLTLSKEIIDLLISNQSYKFSIKVDNGFGEVIKDIGTSLIFKPIFDATITCETIYKPFTQSDNFEIWATNLDSYYTNKTLKIEYNNISYTPDINSTSSTSSQYTYSLKKDFYNLTANPLKFSNYDNNYIVTIKMIYDSDLGYEQIISTTTNFNFVESISENNFTGFSITGYTGSIYEGDILKFSINAFLYNANTLRFQPQIKRGSANWENLNNLSGTSTFSISEGIRSEKSSSTIILNYTVLPINTSVNNQFRMIITDKNNNTYTINYSTIIASKRLIIPNFTISTFKYTNKHFIYTYDISDFGADSDYTSTLKIQASADGLTFYDLGTKNVNSTPFEGEIDNSSGDNDWNLLYIKSTLTTTLKGNSKSIERITIVYNSQPTISYRPNHLGINYKDIDNDTDTEISEAIIVIGETNQRNKIIYKGANYGELIGFSASGGTW